MTVKGTHIDAYTTLTDFSVALASGRSIFIFTSPPLSKSYLQPHKMANYYT